MSLRPPAIAVVILLAGGCAWTPRPYAHDPLLRGGRGLITDPRAIREPAPPPDPQPPLPPLLTPDVAGT
jgi:hypothetical protein